MDNNSAGAVKNLSQHDQPAKALEVDWESRYRDLVNSLNAGVATIAADGWFLDANPAFLKIFGFSGLKELLFEYKWPALFADSEEKEAFAQVFADKETVKCREALLRRRQGDTFWALVSVVPGSRPGKTGNVTVIVDDITDRKALEGRLNYLATHDTLTNIPNRFFLEEALRREAAKARRGEKSALLLINIDNFKIINDTLGRTAGDELLVTLAKILKNTLREGDLLARLEGDEFAVLLERVTHKDVWVVAEKLCRAVDESMLYLSVNKQCLNSSISIGIIMIDGTLDDQKLLSYAGAAVHKAREEGRNTIVFAQPDRVPGTGYNGTGQVIPVPKKYKVKKIKSKN